MELVRIVDGKKFMWDGLEYKDGLEAKQVKEKYESDGFEVRLIEEKDKFFVFSRRLVKDVKVEGPPPI